MEFHKPKEKSRLLLGGIFFIAMVDLQELWVGDRVKLLKSGRTGYFQGLSGAKARIKVGDKILLVSAKGLEIFPETEADTPDLLFEEEISKPLRFHEFPNSIDLHIEVLAPEMRTQPALAILNYQLTQLKEYLDKAEMAGLRFLTIIHGKGTGVLKKEVIHHLKGRERVQYIIEINDGGASEVHLTPV